MWPENRSPPPLVLHFRVEWGHPSPVIGGDSANIPLFQASCLPRFRLRRQAGVMAFRAGTRLELPANSSSNSSRLCYCARVYPREADSAFGRCVDCDIIHGHNSHSVRSGRSGSRPRSHLLLISIGVGQWQSPDEIRMQAGMSSPS